MNEAKFRKELITAFGGTGTSGNEDKFERSLINAVENSISKSKPAVVALVSLTNNSGGTANDTVEVVPAAVAATTDTSAASLTSTNTALTAIKNDIADLTAKVNAIIAALKA